jgi:hypothetical protein
LEMWLQAMQQKVEAHSAAAVKPVVKKKRRL